MSKTPPDTRRGAPLGNMHAAKHGRRSRRQRFCLTLNTAGPRDRKIIERLRGLRKHLEAAVDDVYGTVDLTRASLINSCLRHEMVASLSARWLREEGDRLPVSDRLALVRGIASASDSRDKAIRQLGLERTASDIWSTIYSTPLSPPQPADDSEAAETTTDAGDEATSDDSGNGEGR